MNWSGEMILRRYGLTLNIKRGTIEHNEHRDMVLLHFMGLFPRLLFFSVIVHINTTMVLFGCVIELALGFCSPQYPSILTTVVFNTIYGKR